MRDQNCHPRAANKMPLICQRLLAVPITNTNVIQMGIEIHASYRYIERRADCKGLGLRILRDGLHKRVPDLFDECIDVP